MNAIEQGSSITPAYLTKAECTLLIDALSTRALSRSRAGARHLMGSQVVAALAQSDLLIGLASDAGREQEKDSPPSNHHNVYRLLVDYLGSQ